MIKNLNYILIISTIAILAAIGLVFIYGTGFSWIKSLQEPEWRNTFLYQEYLSGMNLAVVPLIVALIAVIGMCIPKRLFSGYGLLALMGAMLAGAVVFGAVAGPLLGAGFIKAALSFILGVAVMLQVLVILMTLFGSKSLYYENQSFYIQIGSAFLHLGLIIFVFNLVLLAEAPEHISIFWLATAFIGTGMVMVFYSEEMSGLASGRSSGKALPGSGPAAPQEDK